MPNCMTDRLIDSLCSSVAAIHTYIIGHYNLSVSITTQVVCVNFIHGLRDRSTDYWETFLGSFICSQSFCQKSAERKSSKKCIFNSSFASLTWVLNLGLTSNKPAHYILDYGDFFLANMAPCRCQTLRKFTTSFRLD